ncbi:hypothetical protein AGMMS49950_11140 [Endomicrobiia bacterium]|nr:hypothetical protein AGMMS49950_11140 [Endomicrobiia bacterium]
MFIIFPFINSFGCVYNIIMLILLLSFVAYTLPKAISHYRQNPQEYMESIRSAKVGKFLIDKFGVTMAKFIGWTLTGALAVLFVWWVKHLIVTYCI